MLRYERLDDSNILTITTDGPLEQTDFEEFAKQLEEGGTARPTRLMIQTSSFPGWESFEAFLSHLKFVSEHHQQIQRIAIVTDSELLKIMPHVAGLLVHPKIKQFELDETAAALTWLEQDSQ